MLEVTPSAEGLTVEAPAKVNLTLRVLGMRGDGYHDLESVVAAVSLFDTLLLRPADEMSLVCRGGDVPGGEDNLVMKAARALAAACGVRRGARIELEKRIPAGRGFGGGSSDAAAALIGLNALWDCGLGREDLARLGASVGSDVPLFFGLPVAVVRGRGERVEPVAASPPWWVVLAWPDFGFSTAEVYAAYDRLVLQRQVSRGGLPRPPRFEPRRLPGGLGRPPGGVKERSSATGLGVPGGDRPAATAILPRLAGPSGGARPFLVNDLGAAADIMRGGRMDVRACLEGAGGVSVGMTGSGSACFALADTEAEARRLAQAARSAGTHVHVARLLVDEPEQRETPS